MSSESADCAISSKLTADCKPAGVTVRIDTKKMDWASFNAKDALTDAPLAVKDGAIRLSFSGMSYHMVEIRQ